jgi:hypothetical protein
MTNQRSDISDLSVIETPPAAQARVWSPGAAEDGIDERVELAQLDASEQVAVRDAQHPSGPALLFSRDSWNALLGQEPAVVDLRQLGQ